jgi:hypothetical protein
LNWCGYLNVDRQSEWQKSALVASAIETVTLPSRLRPYQGRPIFIGRFLGLTAIDFDLINRRLQFEDGVRAIFSKAARLSQCRSPIRMAKICLGSLSY